MKNLNRFVISLIALTLLCGCAHKSGHLKKRERREMHETDRTYRTDNRKISSSAEIMMIKEGGVYYIPVVVNGLQLKFVFDTGASSICISSAEAIVMVKQGLITQDDIIGEQQMMDATGGISVGTSINLREVEIGGIKMRNIDALVVDNGQAPLLLGQTALSKFGKVTIDYENGIIEFN